MCGVEIMNTVLWFYLVNIFCFVLFVVLLFLMCWRGFIPLFFPKTLKRLFNGLNVKPLIYDESGKLIECCSNPVLHNIKGSRCVWCDQSIAQLSTNQVVGLNTIYPLVNNVSDPQPDFNSPATATVNILFDADVPEFPEISKSSLNPQSMDLVRTQSYCLRCRCNVEVLDPEYFDQDSRRGVRRYLKGLCSQCGSKINAIVKRG